MKKIYLLLFSALFFSCTDELDSFDPESVGAIELKGIRATIVSSEANTRADKVYLSEHISRFRFEDNDKMTLTTIKRTQSALSAFNYVDVEFTSNANGAWTRNKNTGHLDGGDETHPARIYWSDATSQHTFIGYSLPKVANSSDFGWTKQSDGTYFGAIGNPSNDSEEIDFNPVANEADDEIKEKDADGHDVTKKVKKSSKMRAEDLLLTYSTTLVADASVANVDFYHALSSIKVQVSMSNFYGSELDAYTIVEDMKLLDQPTLYKWNMTDAKAQARSSVHNDNKPKNMKLWDYYPEGNGKGASKTFTFYGITVPQGSDYPQKDLVLTFDVKYPDPIKTDLENLKTNPQTEITWITKPFKATIPASTQRVYFYPGKCTVINMRLNHMDQELTVGAEYMDWQFIASPDEGDLKKNTTFLKSVDRTAVKLTIDNVTKDDATWLYKEKNVNGEDTGNVLDINGNTGTIENPYSISKAEQLLAFAYEVNNGMNFSGKYVKLDADIYLQPSTAEADLLLEWIGIGTNENVFQGTFIGGDRKISLLKGSPLFNIIGNAAVIDNLTISNKAEVTGTGALANINKGKVIGCVIDADVKSNAASAGSLLGLNEGSVETSYHIGSMEGTSAVAGLVGQNSGSMVGCYNSGSITGSGTNYGVTSKLSSGTVEGCYYNKTIAGDLGDLCGEGKTTLEMQKMSFTILLNLALPTNSKYSYKFFATMFPSLELYNVPSSDVELQEGFYRVKNIGSERYVHVTDKVGHYNSSSYDLDAIVLRKDINSSTISDPASIIYVSSKGYGKYDFRSQGISLYQLTGQYATIYPTKGYYRVGASKDNTFVHYLIDYNADPSNEYSSVNTNIQKNTSTTINKFEYFLWDAIPVDDESNYFGIKPSVTIDSKHYAPFYAGFGFEAPSNVEVFYISKMNESEGKVCLKKIVGDIPSHTPVIFASSSSSPSDNRLSLKNDDSNLNLGDSRNFLEGNMFSFDNSTIPGKNTDHNSRVSYNPETMRVLGINNNKLAFIRKSSDELPYLLANQSYLVVSPNAPNVIYVESEETYNGNTSGGSNTNNPIASGYYRVRNFGSQRYISVMDDKVSISVQNLDITHDLMALELKKTLDYTDPASIIYVTENGDVTSQGVSLKSKINDFTINERKIDDKTHYRVGAERDGLSRYICDSNENNDEENGVMDTYVTSNHNYLYWDAVLIENESNYFGIKPSVTVTISNEENSSQETKYFSSFYAEFGFEVPTGMTVYVVDKIETTTDEDSSTSTTSVILKPLTGTIVPNKTPVIVEWSSATANSNKVSLKYSDTNVTETNKLLGNMFNSSIEGHVNRKSTTANMRVLAVDNGVLVFKKPEGIGTTYLPANSSYLIVEDDVPETLTVVFENN